MTDLVPLGELRSGDMVLIGGTVEVSGPAVYVIFDAEVIWRVILMPDDVLVEKVGRSPNFPGQKRRKASWL